MMPPLSAYLHVPFCTHRCGYCNFTLVSGRPDLVGPFLDAIERELSQLETPRPVRTMFFGGGTPTYLPSEALARFLTIVQRWHPLQAGGEWSVEANPLDVTPTIIAQLAAAGVTRISLGAQSFSPRKLKLLERDHSAEVIDRVVATIRAARLQVSLDLIFGVPDETLEEWQADLQQAIALAPDHVSTYGLTWELGTSYWTRRERGELSPVDEETERSMYLAAIATLQGAGFEHYEVSNFAQPGFRCRHNEAYWLGEEYFAAGPGAARYIDGERSVNHRSTTTWLQRIERGESPIAERETLSQEERARELLVFGLRRLEGVSAAWFLAKSGLELRPLLGERGRRLIEHELLRWDEDRLCLTQAGLLIADAICEELLRE
jgi:oxygen-independent coproporphyrinogen-3 oxidase